MKSVRIRSFSGLYFSAFGLNILRIQSECGKIRARKIPNMDTFHAVLFSVIVFKAKVKAGETMIKELYIISNRLSSI